MFEETKQNIINEMKSSLKSENIVSCSVIGSFAKKEMLEKVNDVDILVFYKKINQEDYTGTLDAFQRICDKLSDEETVFVVEGRNGPLKKHVDHAGRMVQFHVLSFDYNTIGLLPSVIRYEYAHASTICLKGQRLDEIFKKSDSVMGDAVNEQWGLKTCLGVVQDFKIPYFEWRFSLVPAAEEIRDSHTFFEAIQYSTLTACMNFLRATGTHVERGEKEVLEKMKELFPEHGAVLEKIVDVKRRLRSGGDIEDVDMIKLRYESTMLIKDLISRIEIPRSVQ
jgi:Nucleotidyltransferase domain